MSVSAKDFLDIASAILSLFGTSALVFAIVMVGRAAA